MRGFTLIEIIIVIAISVMLGTVSFLYSHTAENEIALSVGQSKVAQAVLDARNLAIATYNTIPGTCGYGVAFNAAASTYSVFAYTPGGTGCPPAAQVTQAPSSKWTEVSQGTWNAYVANGVKIYTAADSLSVVLFYPPNPVTLISRDGGATFLNQTSKIHLETADGSTKTSVTVNPEGQVNLP